MLITIMIKFQHNTDALIIMVRVIINSDTTIVMGIELAVLMDGAKEHLDDLFKLYLLFMIYEKTNINFSQFSQFIYFYFIVYLKKTNEVYQSSASFFGTFGPYKINKVSFTPTG